MINFRLIRHLWLFLQVAEKEHFGKAAQALGMSQPPLTEQIKILEQHLGLTLFERSRQGTKLSAEGRAILPAVQRFAEQMEQLEYAVNEAARGQSGVLTIGAITQALSDVLPPLLDKIRAAYPHLTVKLKEIDSAQAVPLLREKRIDLAFARLEGKLADDIATMPLADSALAAALPVQHPLADKQVLHLADLADEDFVMFAREISPLSFDTLIAACVQAGFSPRILHEVRSAMSQLAFVSCNQGVALVPESQRNIAPNNVRIVPLAGSVRLVTTAMAWCSSGNGLAESVADLLR